MGHEPRERPADRQSLLRLRRPRPCRNDRLNADLAWCAETDQHCQAILAARFEGVPNLGDITAVDWADVPPVDMVTAGWPYQDISLAGQGAGIKEGTRSGLWFCITACLRQLRPAGVFLENVASLRIRGLARVLADLARLGYDAQWATVRASDVGAPHERARLFVLAVRSGFPGRLLSIANPAGPRSSRRAAS